MEIHMKHNTLTLIYIALSTTLIIVCTYITLPFFVPFTMQTFAIFTIIGLFGTKNALCSLFLYLTLGSIGLPVFSGFRSGIGTLASMTGGYLIGFLWMCLVTGGLISFFKKKNKVTFFHYFVSMLAGLIICYAFGTLWYIFLYTDSTKALFPVLSMFVFPFILPDICKIVLSISLIKILKKHLYRLGFLS